MNLDCLMICVLPHQPRLSPFASTPPATTFGTTRIAAGTRQQINQHNQSANIGACPQRSDLRASLRQAKKELQQAKEKLAEHEQSIQEVKA
mmetsp:Transcript_18302/g.50808  ORF Transcript_18302/g.50808 Transcript_18302/m.50808 type:complete len:91 (-) Transcript_18302:192-464(-)